MQRMRAAGQATGSPPFKVKKLFEDGITNDSSLMTTCCQSVQARMVVVIGVLIRVRVCTCVAGGNLTRVDDPATMPPLACRVASRCFGGRRDRTYTALPPPAVYWQPSTDRCFHGERMVDGSQVAPEQLIELKASKEGDSESD